MPAAPDDDAEADETYTTRTMQELDVTDAGIVVFLSPPTVGATEMGFLTEVVSRNIRKTFLVCNMYPQHFHDPETRSSVLEYTGRRIVEACERAGMSGEVRVYPVCALEAWEARAIARSSRLSGRTPPRLITVLRDWPLVTAPMSEELTGASRAAIQRNLAWLEAEGLVQEVTGQGRYRVWRASD